MVALDVEMDGMELDVETGDMELVDVVVVDESIAVVVACDFAVVLLRRCVVVGGTVVGVEDSEAAVPHCHVNAEGH